MESQSRQRKQLKPYREKQYITEKLFAKQWKQAKVNADFIRE